MAEVALVSPAAHAAHAAPAIERPDFEIVSRRGLLIVGVALVALTLALVLFAVPVPILIGFTVARYE